MRTVSARPLSVEAYTPFGEVLGARDTAFRSANQGTARVWDRLVDLENRRADARLNASVFRCQPRREPLELTLLERHPLSTQLFVPMTPARYLVVVALGGEAPDLTTLQAFVVEGSQGVSYRPGVWHHPMLVLNAGCDFACFVFEDGTASDCEVVPLESAITVSL